MLAAVDPMPVCVALDFAQEGFTLEEARAAVEAVALAFLRLPESRRAALLKGEM
jgi:hypothetical protein